ncbi:hypothetical protein QBC34DRAFT_450309 [Podospora aff. communis PSN243]|uniref:DUF1479 domain protein n=1 Tax=Podospora aff. communis PSN243 TaxID=3040156 RepID=A0AAV9GH69_9PEZI|nr:hypothetical protein QBC34DRAFT_450309 [Podospora aff. communis PSN243]
MERSAAAATVGAAVAVSTRTTRARDRDAIMGGTEVTEIARQHQQTTTPPSSSSISSPPPSASILVDSSNSSPGRIGKGKGVRSRCAQCGRRRSVGFAAATAGEEAGATGACNHSGGNDSQQPAADELQQQLQLQQLPTSPSSAPPITANGAHSAALTPAAVPPVPAPLHHLRPRRISKLKHRALTATLSQLKNAARSPPNTSAANTDRMMEPPVLSFYGTEPVPLPTRFAHIKRSLAAGHEAEIEASWARLLDALKGAVDHIESRGPNITPSIDFADIDKPAAQAEFQRDLRRYGVGVVRGVVPRQDAQAAIDETVKYLETKHDFKQPSPQDPTCFDFFWTPAQVRTRAHPAVLEAQRFAMSLWDNHADDRMATRFPISYADRLRIHGANIGGVGPDKGQGSTEATGADEEEERAFVEQFGDFASSTLIAQVDNGSLERWEPDGYGRGGTYKAVFEGDWEKYDAWDPTHRVTATQDLYNGYGACSIFRMFNGVVALSTIEPGLIRLLPMPKLATAYFLLRPFFSPKTKAPERRDGPEWEAFLDASNWQLDRDYNTIIHGAVPGHAQRLTERWHPHLHLRRTLVTIPTLQTGDYMIWHPDLAYHMSSNPSVMASRAPTPPPMEDGEPKPSKPVSILVYAPAAPLTQTNALFLARQRKTFQRGHPSPDFDSTGSGLGSEASHASRPGETDIAEVGGPAALQAMGLAPFDVAPTPPTDASSDAPNGLPNGEDIDMDGASAGTSTGGRSRASSNGNNSKSATRAEAEVARLANIILFPDSAKKEAAAKTAAKAATNGLTTKTNGVHNGLGKREREEDDDGDVKDVKME